MERNPDLDLELLKFCLERVFDPHKERPTTNVVLELEDTDAEFLNPEGFLVTQGFESCVSWMYGMGGMPFEAPLLLFLCCFCVRAADDERLVEERIGEGGTTEHPGSMFSALAVSSTPDGICA